MSFQFIIKILCHVILSFFIRNNELYIVAILCIKLILIGYMLPNIVLIGFSNSVHYILLVTVVMYIIYMIIVQQWIQKGYGSYGKLCWNRKKLQ